MSSEIAREVSLFFWFQSDYFSKRNVLRGWDLDAKGLMDTEQALLWGVWSPEVDTAGRDAREQSARAGHGRNRSDWYVSIVEDIREILDRRDFRLGRESEQLVCEGVVVRPATMAGSRSRIQHRRNADAPATFAERKICKSLGKRNKTRFEIHTGDQLGRSRRDKRGDHRAAEYRV